MHIVRSLVLCLLLLVPCSLRAADFGLNGVEVRAGIVSPEDFDTGYSVGVGLDLGDFADRFTLVAGADYWKASGSDAGVDLDATNLSAGADVRYYLSELRRGFYAGAGARLNHTSAEAAISLGSFGTLAVKTTQNRLSPEGIVGYTAGRFNLEARYSAIQDVGTLSVVAGVRFGG
jgi:hypothetical protein